MCIDEHTSKDVSESFTKFKRIHVSKSCRYLITRTTASFSESRSEAKEKYRTFARKIGTEIEHTSQEYCVDLLVIMAPKKIRLTEANGQHTENTNKKVPCHIASKAATAVPYNISGNMYLFLLWTSTTNFLLHSALTKEAQSLDGQRLSQRKY